MKTDGSTMAASKNSTEGKVQALFSRMNRQIAKVVKDVTPENVHHFRTNTRRVEALLERLTPHDGSESKLLKQLSKLRKKAGKLRDLDVQIEFLKELRVPDRQSHRSQLLEKLDEEKAKRVRKLAGSFDANSVRKLRNRLRKARGEMHVAGVDPLKLAFSCLPQPAPEPMTEKHLHACRIAAKRARYLAELSDSSVAKQFVEELKRAQDAIGEWHDILKLTKRAEKLFGGVRESALVAVLQNISRARYRRASSTLMDALRAVTELQRQNLPAQKTPVSAPASSRSAAA
jgi:CHAD domain-containing protein